jgi:hypothetical protein
MVDLELFKRVPHTFTHKFIEGKMLIEFLQQNVGIPSSMLDKCQLYRKVNVKIKLSQCLTKYHAVKTY